MTGRHSTTDYGNGVWLLCVFSAPLKAMAVASFRGEHPDLRIVSVAALEDDFVLVVTEPREAA